MEYGNIKYFTDTTFKIRVGSSNQRSNVRHLLLIFTICVIIIILDFDFFYENYHNTVFNSTSIPNFVFENFSPKE